jgi:hypothetical protein
MSRIICTAVKPWGRGRQKRRRRLREALLNDPATDDPPRPRLFGNDRPDR